MNTNYKHTQSDFLTPLLLVAGALFLILCVLALDNRMLKLALVAAGVSLKTLAVCRTNLLTIEISPPDLCWWKGLHGRRYSVSLADIVGIRRRQFARAERGVLGIRWLRRRPVYRVVGIDGVQIDTRDGQSVLLGTDEPDELLSALDAAMESVHAGLGS